jgi:hypothetical protein
MLRGIDTRVASGQGKIPGVKEIRGGGLAG